MVLRVYTNYEHEHVSTKGHVIVSRSVRSDPSDGPSPTLHRYRIPQRPSSPPSPPRTPLPTPSGSSSLSPAWDPSSQTPACSTLLSPAWGPSSQTPMQSHKGPHWLKEPVFSATRVKLRRH